MVTEKIILENPERFTGEYTISKEKLTKAIEKAADKLESQIPRFKEGFAATCSVNYKYPKTVNNNWICGMHTGTFLLAYELTGNQKFREVVESHLPTYRNRLDKKIAVEDHDVGFVFTPSCVAAYKALGDENARQTALDAAEHLYHFSYSKKGGFILRVASQQHKPEYCRTMMDTLMNAPLLFWAGQEIGRQEYIDAAASQNKITEQYLIRAEAYCRKGQYSKASADLTELNAARNAKAPAVNADNWLDVISDERVKELYMEGFRLHDLKRWNRGFERTHQSYTQPEGSTKKIAAGDYRFVWPIPQNDIEAPGSEITGNESNK